MAHSPRIITFKNDEIYRLLSRIRVRTGVSIEFADIPSIDCLIWRENPYHRWTYQNGGVHLPPTHFTAPVYRDFITTVNVITTEGLNMILGIPTEAWSVWIQRDRYKSRKKVCYHLPYRVLDFAVSRSTKSRKKYEFQRSCCQGPDFAWWNHLAQVPRSNSALLH